MGASAILKGIDFRAFAINVKTIASTQKLYQSGHAIWYGRSVDEPITGLLLDCSAKKIVCADFKIIRDHSNLIIWDKSLSAFNPQNCQITEFTPA